MKIRPSLRLYFFISIFLLGSAMAVGFSLLSVNYYIDGLDKGIKSVMRELAKTPNIEDGKPQPRFYILDARKYLFCGAI